MKKYAATIRIPRENCEMLHWSKTRGGPQHDASTHESPSGANKRTTTAVIIGALWAKSELEKHETQLEKELVFTSAAGKLQAYTLCSYKRMSWMMAMTKEQHNVW